MRSAGFTDLSPVSRNRSRLSARAGTLRLVFTFCAMFAAAQFLLPMIGRLALNGGRVWPNDEVHSLWGSVLDERVLSVPALLTILTGAVGMVAAAWYLLTGGRTAASDAASVSLVSILVFGMLPWAIAGFDADPSGIVRTPEPDSSPLGWHWVLTPLSVVVLVIGIVVSVRGHRASRKAASARLH